MPHTLGKPRSTGVWILGNRTPRGRDASKVRSLAKVREAHCSALAAAATLEGEQSSSPTPSSGANQKHRLILTVETTTDIGLGNGREGTARCSQRIAMPPTSSVTLL